MGKIISTVVSLEQIVVLPVLRKDHLLHPAAVRHGYQIIIPHSLHICGDRLVGPTVVIQKFSVEVREPKIILLEQLKNRAGADALFQLDGLLNQLLLPLLRQEGREYILENHEQFKKLEIPMGEKVSLALHEFKLQLR